MVHGWRKSTSEEIKSLKSRKSTRTHKSRKVSKVPVERQGWDKFKYKLNHSKFFIMSIFIAWFLFRVLPRPTRVLYPCQIGILTSMVIGANAFFAGTLAGIVMFWKRLVHSKLFWAGIVFVGFITIGLVMGAIGGVRLF